MNRLILTCALLLMPISALSFDPNDAIGEDFTPIWENEHEDAPEWTRITTAAVEDHGKHLRGGAEDIASFCPKYNQLNQLNRTRFWTQLIAAMTKFESSFDPSTRYVETTMGIDPVTGKRVVSEGLLQLSYQDERNYRRQLPPGVCDFDYPSDQSLPAKDLRRTILNPEINLKCGVWILDNQIRRYKRISIRSGAYWSVLRPRSRSLKPIQNITRALPFCRLRASDGRHQWSDVLTDDGSHSTKQVE